MDGDTVQGWLSKPTRLVQLYTGIPEEAPRLIAEGGGNKNYTPLMVLVDHPNCFAWYMNVPTGMMALE